VSIQRLSHVNLRVQDFDESVQFHTELLGLNELSREGDTVYLGCGFDENYDVALTGGGTGLEHMSFDVTSLEDLDRYSKRLADAGVGTETRSDAGPGVASALRFLLPSGHVMQLITLHSDPAYLRVALPRHPQGKGIAPKDVEHITLHVADGRGLAEFLRDTLDFQISDIVEPAPGVWAATWMHVSDYHHDLATLPAGKDGDTLHHLAWELDGIDHMKRAADLLGHHDIPLETGPGRHSIGSNLFTYFYGPGGNRYEFSAEMARATNRAAEPYLWSEETFPKGFSAWGQKVPESFRTGS
jgi:catechol 2,3-dioxygenase